MTRRQIQTGMPPICNSLRIERTSLGQTGLLGGALRTTFRGPDLLFDNLAAAYPPWRATMSSRAARPLGEPCRGL